MRVFLTSQQKAGTYLGSNLLEELGFQNPLLHFEDVRPDQWRYQKYNTKNIDDVRKRPANYTHHLNDPMRNLKSIVPDNGFAVGHIPYSQHNKKVLEPFKIIVMMRPINECRQSMQRWKQKTGKKYLNLNENLWYDVKQWSTQSNVFQLWFSDLTERRVGRIDALQKFLYERPIYNSMDAIELALKKDSITKNR